MKRALAASPELSSYHREFTKPETFPRELLWKIPPSKIKALRNWQPRAFAQLIEARHSLTVAPCGSGKTIFLTIMAAADLIRHGNRQIVCVPQSHIGVGFCHKGDGKAHKILVDGTEYMWKPEHDLVSGHAVNVISTIQKFLTTPLSPTQMKANRRSCSLESGILVTTHTALREAWLDPAFEEGRRLALELQHLSVTVDETHHVQGVDDELEDLTSDKNRIGHLCHAIINCPYPSIKLRLATATPMRGDNRPIVSPAVRAQMSVFSLPWIEHWETLSIKTLRFHYEMYDADPIRQILLAVAREPQEFHLIAIPNTGDGFRTSGNELERLVVGLRQLYDDSQILDLVTLSTQPANKQRLLEEPKSDRKKMILRVVLSCQMVKEGTDWVACSRLHNAACGSSLTDELQKIGRVLRSIAGKTRVEVRNYLPKLRAEEGEEARTQLSSYTNALLVGFMWDDMTMGAVGPQLPRLPAPASSADSEPGLTLFDMMGAAYAPMFTQLLTSAEALRTKTPKELQRLIEKVLKDHPPLLPEYYPYVVERIQRCLLQRLATKDVRLKGIDVAFVREMGFDRIIWEYDLHENSLYFADFTKAEWPALRNILMRKAAQEALNQQAIHNQKYNVGDMNKDAQKRVQKTGARLRRRARAGVASESEKHTLASLFPRQREGQSV